MNGFWHDWNAKMAAVLFGGLAALLVIFAAVRGVLWLWERL